MSQGLSESFTSERGFLDVLSPASPAAGANYSFTVGSQSVDGLRVVACLATLTTDANAANRFFALDYRSDRYGTVLRNGAPLVVTANTTARVYQWDRAHAQADLVAGSMVWCPLADVILTPGWAVRLTVDNIQVGDTITAISFVVEKFYPDS